MPLNTNYAGEGRGIQQANQVTDSSRAFGNKTKDVLTTPTSVPGQFGNYQGEIAAGESMMKMGAVLDDYVARERNLKIADETTRRALENKQLSNVPDAIALEIKKIKETTTMTADEELEMFTRRSNEEASKIRANYKYETRVGDSRDAEFAVEQDGWKNAYTAGPIEQARVASKQSHYSSLMTELEIEARQKYELGAGPAAMAVALKQAYDLTSSHEYIMLHGGTGAGEKHGQAALKAFTLDMMALMSPEDQVALMDRTRELDPMDPTAVDISKFLDPSDYKSFNNTARAALKEKQKAIEAAQEEQQTNALYASGGFYDRARNATSISQLTSLSVEMMKARDAGHIQPKVAARYLDSIQEDRKRIEAKQEGERNRAATRAQTEAIKQATREQHRMQSENQAMTGNQGPVDSHYSKYVEPQLAGKSPEQQRRIVEDYVRITKIVPSQITNPLIADITSSKDPQVIRNSLAKLNALVADYPNTYASLPQTAKTALELSRGPHSPTDIQEKVKASTTTSPEEKKSRGAIWTGKTGVKTRTAVIAALAERMNVDKGSVPEVLVNRAMIAARETYEQTGDLKVSLSQTANEYHSKGYGKTNINGSEQVMLYPPDSDADGNDIPEARDQYRQEVLDPNNLTTGRYSLQPAGTYTDPKTKQTRVYYNTKTFDKHGKVGWLENPDGTRHEWMYVPKEVK